MTGHAFLIDSEGYVRWKAHAKPTDEELESMKTCTERLLKINKLYVPHVK